jgi:hypothetical protein
MVLKSRWDPFIKNKYDKWQKKEQGSIINTGLDFYDRMDIDWTVRGKATGCTKNDEEYE